MSTTHTSKEAYVLHDDGSMSARSDVYASSKLMELTLATLKRLQTSSEAESKEDDALKPWRRTHIPAKTLQDLQWSSLIEHLSAKTLSPEGVLLTRTIAPLEDKKAIMRRMWEVDECKHLVEQDDSPPLRGLSDIRQALAHVQRGGSLVGSDLYAIARNCDVASRCARYFKHREHSTIYLSEVASRLNSCDTLREVLNRAVEPDGRLSDKASPDLRKLRHAVQNQHDRIRTQIDRMLRSRDLEHYLQDDYYTVREDRYVLPVRIGGKGGVPGIVHGYSSSGQTAFIEPSEMIELNNQLRWAQIELQEEEERILRRLSEQVANHAHDLDRTSDILAYLDFTHACGKLSSDLMAHVPHISDGKIDLRQTRHPLLFLKCARMVKGVRVNDTVPNDLRMDPDKQILIVSGPNTGGKTVLLKTLGLCALMTRCGLPIPADEGSCLPLFRGIYSDIGDEQSIEHDLSTFSGHLTNINTFIDACDHDSLVLLDELFTGTDPLQGAALAVALLEELTSRQARGVVTTHLESLKTLAFQKEAYANASMGFNLDSLAPSYTVTYGLPGSSYAIRIAERLGFPKSILNRAHSVLEGQEHQSVEEILSALEDRRADMEREQRRLTQSRHETEQARIKFKKKYDNLLAREKEQLHEQSRRLKKELDHARDTLRQRAKELRQANDPARARMTQRDLNLLREEMKPVEEAIERAQEYTRPVESGPTGLAYVQPEQLEEGLEVYIHAFKRKGHVLSYREGSDEAMVQIGALKVKHQIDDLFFPTEATRRAHVRGEKPTTQRKSDSHMKGETQVEESEHILLPQTSDNSVDLRGRRVDEALEMLDLFLDSAYLNDMHGVYIIHGHGTGALKRAVRGYLPTSRYVDHFRRGARGEGGDGATIAILHSEH